MPDANNCFEQWFTKPGALRMFAEIDLPLDPQETILQLLLCKRCSLQSDTAHACIKVISLLEKAVCCFK